MQLEITSCTISNYQKQAELRSNGSQAEMISDHLNNLSIQLSEAEKKLVSTCSAYTNAETDNDTLVTQILQTRELLKELVRRNWRKKIRRFDSLQAEFYKVAKTYLADSAEWLNVSKQLQEKKKIGEQINGMCVKAKAGI